MGITNQMESLALSHEVPNFYKAICVKINEIPTDIVYADHLDKIVIFATQFQKIGSLLSVTKDQIESLDSVVEAVYCVKPITGSENIEQEVAVRYIAEQLDINKKLLIFISLKSYNKEVVKAVADTIINLRNNKIK